MKSHELRHEPGLTELGSSPFLNSLNASVSCQKVMELASKKESVTVIKRMREKQRVVPICQVCCKAISGVNLKRTEIERALKPIKSETERAKLNQHRTFRHGLLRIKVN